MADSLGGLATLPTRPPTPPKDAEADSVGRILDYPSYLPNSTRQTISTPDDSPSSSAEYFTKSSNKFSKRVDFSPWISYTPPSVTAKGISRPDQQRLLPPSRECRSSRSILKPYDTTSHWESISLVKKDRKPLPEMLEELCRQLASTSRSSRLDAYMALNDCLKAYKDVPDQPALEAKLPLLTGFIRRDLLATSTSTGATDIQIITQALKLLTTLIWTVPLITSLLQEDFCAFVVDQAITSCGDSKNVSKAVIGHYLHVLSIQKFGPKVMTNERVGRLLDTIQEINIKGNGIVGQRLIVYRRLLSQAKSLMAARVSDWVDHLFTGMLSTLKEIRRRALDFGLEAALSLGSMSQTSRCVLEIFERRSAEGKKFRELLVRRLNDMIGSADECSHVPPIWSVVIMFFQSRRNQLEHWEHIRVWLSIIQTCLNSSDKKMKFQATLAWNRLIYTVSPDATTKNSMVRMLRQPMMPLDRKMIVKSRSVQVKSHASSSYCTMLYYAFRPGASYEQLDRFWAECVDPILPASLSASEVDTTFACQILIALFGDAQQKPWTENRGHEGHIIKPEELPRLDPRWTRLRASTIMKLFEIMFVSANWKTAKNEEIGILQAWSSFTKALGDAGSKEVKVSVETIGAVAHILNSMKHFWSYSTSTQTPSDTDPSQSIVLRRLISIVKVAVENLGDIAFTEKRLTRGTNELFEAAETPSSRTNHHGILSSPIVHLIEMLSSSVSLDEVQELYKEAIADWVQVAIRGSTLRQNKFKVLHEIAFLNMTGISQPEVKPILWQVILDCIGIPTINLDSRMETSSTSLGHEYRDVVKILEVGIRLSFEPSQSWPTLIKIVVDGAKQEIGVGGLALAIIEPLAKSLNQELSKRYNESISRCGAAIVQNTMWPRSRKEMEHAHRALWGTSTTSPKVNPFDHLYLFTDSLLLAAYQSFRESAPSNTNEILRASISILSSCPPSLSAVLLQRIQRGLAKWLEDTDGLMDGVTTNSKSIFPVVQQLGTTVTKSIEALPNFDSKHLSAIETLILAGLSSRHKSIANQSINLWNHTFGISTDMEYSESLRKILSRLNRYADIAMQNSKIEEDLESVSSPINFIETQDSFDDNAIPNLESRDGKEMGLPGSTTENPECIGPSDIPARSTPEPLHDGNGPKKTSNLRLRHENSQIEFAAIESSPYDLDALESQFLTTRQKEVKERQHQEAAAMFPDLRSSPGPKSRGLNQDLPKLYQNSRRVTRDQDLPEEMSSPILPPADSRMIDTFVGSSPTPRSNRHSTNRVSRIEDPPSSPPAVARLTTVSHRTNTSTNPRLLAFEQPRTPNSAQISDSNPEPEAPYQSPAKFANETNDESDHEFELPSKVILHRDEDDSDIILPDTSKSKDNPASDLDIFPDAQSTRSSSESLLDSPASHVEIIQELHGNRVLEDVVQKSPPSESKRITDELHDSKPQDRNIGIPYEQASVTSPSDQAMAEPVSPDLDEQISAQIAMDMERALSQVDLSSPDVLPTVATTADSKKKRKRGAGVPVRSSKRHKSRKPPAVQVVVERRQSPAIEDEEMYDCIVVASQTEKDAQSPPRSISKKQQSSISVLSSESIHSTMPASRKRKSRSPGHPAMENLLESDTKQPKKRKSDLIDAAIDMADSTLSRRRGRRTISRSSEEDLNSMDNKRLTRSTLTKAMSSTKTMGSHLPGKDDTSTGSPQDKTVTAPLSHNIIEESSHSEHGISELTDMPVRNNSISTLPRNERGAKRETESPLQLEGHSSPVHEISPHPTLSTSSANGDTEIVLETVSSVVEETIEEDRSMPVTKEDLLTRLKLILRDAKHVTLDPTEALDLMLTLMEVSKELHEAGGRSRR